jgi:Kef-type K+ transport system membrane component KefB
MPTPTPPPLGGHPLLVLLAGVLLLLSCALLLGRLAGRFGLPAVAGELCAGVLIGPSVLDRPAPGVAHWLLPPDPAQAHLLDALGQLGVVLLVGITGIDVDVDLVRRRRRTALRIGVAGLVLPLALGTAAGLYAPSSVTGTSGRATFALFIGVAMCVSALPVIAKMLSDMRLLHREVGQLTIAAGVVDDVIGWMLLSLVSAAATVGLSGAAVWRSAGWIVVTVVGALVVGRPLVRRSLDVAGRSGESGPVICTAVVVVLAGATATQAMGMEASFGAFVAGLLLGTAAPDRLLRLAPLRTVVLTVLAPLFFAEAGLRMDLTVFDRPSLVLAALGALGVAVLGKFAGAFLGARLSRLSRWEGLALAAGMNARGVIQIFVASVGLKLGVLNTASYTIVVLVALSTSLTAPPLLRLATARIPVTQRERAWRPKTGQPAGHG